MSISSISAATYTPPTSGSSLQSQILQAFKNLAQALQSNNLTGAQQAYTTLSQLIGSQGSSSQNSTNPLSQALSQIGSDLQSNNLAGAQQAFASLLQQASQQASTGQPQTDGHHGHHHHHGTGSVTQATSGTSLTGAASGPGSLNAIA